MVTSLKSLRLEEGVPYLVTICFKISGVIGSFLCIVWPTVLITPSFTLKTKSDVHGLYTPASLCAQLML